MDPKQIDRYVIWINRTLKNAGKRYDIKTLTDAKMRSGLVLIDLVEYFSRSPITNLTTSCTKKGYLNNIQQVLNHVTRFKIKMTLIQASDIESGDVSAIIRFLLGIIKHYQPHLVRQKSTPDINGSDILSSQLINTQTESFIPRSIHWKRSLTPSLRHSNIKLRSLSHSNSMHAGPYQNADLRSSVPIHPQSYQPSPRRPQSAFVSDDYSITPVIVDMRSQHSGNDQVNNFGDDCGELSKDIHQIHCQLKQLKDLLSKPGPEPDDKIKSNSSQANANNEQITTEKFIAHKDGIIQYQNDQITHLKSELQRKSRLLEDSMKDNIQLRNSKVDDEDYCKLEIIVPFLIKLKSDKIVLEDDTFLINDLIDILRRLQGKSRQNKVITPTIQQTVAVVSPQRVEKSSYRTIDESINNGSNNTTVLANKTTKLIYSLSEDSDRYMVTIYSPCDQITLADIKKHTSHLIDKYTKYRYLFKYSPTEDVRVELLNDSENVPTLSEKINVLIKKDTRT